MNWAGCPLKMSAPLKYSFSCVRSKPAKNTISPSGCAPPSAASSNTASLQAVRAGTPPLISRTPHLPFLPTSRAAITTEKELAGLLRAVAEYDGSKHIRIALLLLVHLFCRPGQLRQMEWVELDDAKKLWLIPASRMKMRKAHVVPLSAQSLALIEELRPMTGAGRFSFPSLRSPGKPISENTLNATLRRLGYTKEEVCSHGFRSTASTLLNESGRFNPDAIEAQLAHRPQGGAVRRLTIPE